MKLVKANKKKNTIPPILIVSRRIFGSFSGNTVNANRIEIKTRIFDHIVTGTSLTSPTMI